MIRKDRLVLQTLANRIVFLFLALQMADLLTTMQGLSVGAIERNPLAAWWISILGTALGLATLKVFAAIVIVAALVRLQTRWPARQLHWHLLRAANVYYSAVVLSNLAIVVNLIASRV